MKTIRLVSTPTRNRRLNEIIGMVVLVAAALLLLALASYTPTDPSFNTVGRYVTGRPAHNWTGMVGAYLADAMLQLIGVAAFFLPLVLGRLGICWMRSRPAGSPLAKTIGLGNVGGVRAGGDRVAAGVDCVAALAAHRRHLGTSAGGLPGALPEPARRGDRADADGRGVALSGDDVYVQHSARVGDDPVWLCAAAVGLVGAAAQTDVRVPRPRSKRPMAASASRPTRRHGGHANSPRRRSESGWSRRTHTLLGGLFGWLGRKKRVEPIAVAPRRSCSCRTAGFDVAGHAADAGGCSSGDGVQHGCCCGRALCRSAGEGGGSGPCAR